MSEYKNIYKIKRDIYYRNVQYGTASYIIELFLKEMSGCRAELMRVLNHKDVRSEKIMEGLAGVEIMIDQLKESLNLGYEEFEKIKEKKIMETAEKLGVI
ncbi:hypothetical protein HMPREF1635_02010 [Clostridiales bacterium S5-A14a]|nr:hypothetical protein HMPREF1635_02010 [Clostridiales bacterium S5-A14a]